MSGLAVVTIAHGRHGHLLGQRRSLACGTRQPDLYVVVAMGDPQLADPSGLPALHTGPGPVPHLVPLDVDPRGLPLAAARNLGMRTAVDAGCDVLVALDVDCLAGPHLLEGYDAAVRAEPDRLWAGPVTYLPPADPGGYPLDRLDELDDPHPARPAPAIGQVVRGGDPDLFWSLSYAISAPTWSRIGGFDEAYVGYGGEDTDFGQRARSAGVDLAWTGSARAYHQHHPVQRPPVQHLEDILRNGRLFRARWGRWPMEGWLREFERLGLVRRLGEDWVQLG